MQGNGRTKIPGEKQTTNKIPLTFLDDKCLQKGNNCIFRLRQETSKVHCMFLAFKILKISTKKSQGSSESQEQSTNNDFPG